MAKLDLNGAQLLIEPELGFNFTAPRAEQAAAARRRAFTANCSAAPAAYVQALSIGIFWAGRHDGRA
jgi:hypothetical protein